MLIDTISYTIKVLETFHVLLTNIFIAAPKNNAYITPLQGGSQLVRI